MWITCGFWAFERMFLWSSFLLLFLTQVYCDVNCPVETRTLTAKDDGVRTFFYFEYTYDPHTKAEQNGVFNRNRLPSKERTVACSWRLEAKKGHFVSVTFTLLNITHAPWDRVDDCLSVYNEEIAENQLLDRLCGEDTPREHYNSSGQSLVLHYTQGDTEGRRSFKLLYSAVPEPRMSIQQLAVIVSCSIAAAGIIFLSLRLSHCCRPCRKRCCPDLYTDPEGSPPARHEHRSLNPTAPPAEMGQRSEEFVGDEEGNWRDPMICGRGTEGGEDVRAAVPFHVPPPSYESIFGADESKS